MRFFFFENDLFFLFFCFSGGGRLRICMIRYGRYSCSGRLSPPSKIFQSDAEGVGGGRK